MQPKLESILNLNLPCDKRESLNEQKRLNLRKWELKLRCMQRQGKLGGFSIAVFSVDRDPDKAFGVKISLDELPPLTTHNGHLFMLRIAELECAEKDKTLYRHLHDIERFAAQGLSKGLALHIPKRLCMKAMGNCYPPNIIGSILCPLVHEMSKYEGIEKWPSPDVLGSLSEAKMLANSLKRIVPRKVGTVTKAAKAKAAKAKPTKKRKTKK